MMNTKYIFITGGVVSSLGKGIISASIGKLLQARGFKVTIQKFDPYINIDPGTLNPYEHGECYVTADGMETDLDLGHYERFTGIRTTRENSITTGRIYKTVIDRERRGDYLGKTIQVVPHITDEIKRRMLRQDVKGEELDFVITEVGGTIGDIESAPFMEAIRQLRWDLGRDAVCVHLTYVPYLKAAEELKTKPTQHSVKELQGMGIQPDILVLRTERHLDDALRMKVASFCNVDLECVVQSEDLPSIYEVPVNMQRQGLDAAILRIYDGVKVKAHFVGSQGITKENVAEQLAGMAGVVICPGFGQRGIPGKIIAAEYARTHDVPCFGICLGMQMMVIEFARDVLGLTDADSTEVNPTTAHNVIDLMEEQKDITQMGGTMRLGEYPCELRAGSRAREAYGGKASVRERHRHRYEFNNRYREEYGKAGMQCVGVNPDADLVEIVEIPDLRWYIGTQFHPEYASTVLHPHPLFMSFVKACADHGDA